MSMMTPMPSPRRKRPAAYWVTPLTSVVLGLAIGAAAWAGDQRGFAVFAVLLMLAVAVGLVVASRRSETISGLLDRRDERIASLDRDATLFSGCVLIVAVLAGFIWEIARGGDGEPFTWLAALGGASYVAALIVLRLRR